jgi:DNA-binding CsgD family transcriptional regulator
MKRGRSCTSKSIEQSWGPFERLAAEKSALDLLTVGVIILDTEANVIFVNKEARTILDMNDGLSIDHGHLALTDAVGTCRFLSALIDPGRNHADSAFRVSRPSGRRAYHCIVSQLDGRPLLQYSKNAVVVMFLTDPERIGSYRKQFETLYDLTPQEAILAEFIARGESLQEAGCSMGIKSSTARSHLKHLMQKVGVQRQGELVSALLKAPHIQHSS